MKLLKIFTAVLFFSFLGSVHNQLSAQPEATKIIFTQVPDYYGKQSLKVDECLDSNNFLAGLRYNETDPKSIELHIVDKTANAIIKRIPLCRKSADNDEVKALYLEWDNSISLVRLKCETKFNKITIGGISVAERNSFASQGHKVLDVNSVAQPSACFTLTSDGNFIIYNQAMPNCTPIFQLGN
jgi:hypothetical protein